MTRNSATILPMSETYAKQIGVVDSQRVNILIRKVGEHNTVYFEKDSNGSEKIQIIKRGGEKNET